MKYKGFDIKPYFSICADWKPNKHDQIVKRTPTSEDIEWYDVFDPMCDDNRWLSCCTIKECKAAIDSYLGMVGMKDNTLESWDKIGD